MISLLYHDYFAYPLSHSELSKWQAGSQVKLSPFIKVKSSHGLYYLKNREKLIKTRSLRQKYSLTKLTLAKRAARTLSKIPTIKFIGITGSLAMTNCRPGSDIDLMIITKKGTLWTTRLLSYFLLRISNFAIRRPQESSERNKLCLNIWMDESDLLIKDQNIFTAHELAQIVPLVNRGETYEHLLSQNRWLLNYWPNSVKIINPKTQISNKSQTKNLIFKYLDTIWNLLFRILNLFSYQFQLCYMKPKITNETITPTRAFFHPTNWSPKIIKYLKKHHISFLRINTTASP